MEIDINTIISSYATVTLFLMMLVIGLKEGFANLSLLWRRPMLLLRCLVASFVLVPIAAMVIVAIVPMGRCRPGRSCHDGHLSGSTDALPQTVRHESRYRLAGSYQVTMSLFAVALVPLWILIINALYVRQDPSSFSDVARQIAYVQLIPITAGLVVRGWLPSLAFDLLKILAIKLSSAMLLGALIIILIVGLPAILQVGRGDVLRGGAVYRRHSVDWSLSGRARSGKSRRPGPG
jgi:BASS family bile acid:Na+ symporter